VIVHDPQPLQLIEHYENKCRWIWRCHIDLSRPQPQMWKYLRRWIDKYDAAIVSCPEYKQEMKPPQRVLCPRSIHSTPRIVSSATRKSTSG
jgi:trehalose synthase